MRTKTLWIKDQYLALILAGRKTVEVRVGYANLLRLSIGDRFLLNDQHPYVIQRIGYYTDFEELLVHEDPSAIAPGLKRVDLLRTLRTLYPPKKEALGVLAFEIVPDAKSETQTT